MQHKASIIVLVVLLLIVAGALFAAYQFNLSALPEPGPTETNLATRLKLWKLARSARGALPAEPANDNASLGYGDMLFTGDCAVCHGQDGRHPTKIGLGLYPRTLALDAPEVQHLSNAELFWVIKNGIRLSGMPAFGRIHSDEEIWHLVHYVRSLGSPPQH